MSDDFKETVQRYNDAREIIERNMTSAVGDYNNAMEAAGLSGRWHDGYLVEAGETHITVGWEEFWAYGGHETGEDDIPFAAVDPATRKEAIKKLVVDKVAVRDAALQMKRDQDARKAARKNDPDYPEYKRLKAKFENNK